MLFMSVSVLIISISYNKLDINTCYNVIICDQFQHTLFVTQRNLMIAVYASCDSDNKSLVDCQDDSSKSV